MKLLFIATCCRKIIGCSDTPIIKKYCDYCQDYQQCLEETPISQPVGRNVFFIKYPRGCEGHNHELIGFKRKEQRNED